jgi:hypothetical protein
MMTVQRVVLNVVTSHTFEDGCQHIKKMCCMFSGSKWSVGHWRQIQHASPKCHYPLQGNTVSQPIRPQSEHFRMHPTLAIYLILVLISTLLCRDEYKWWDSMLTWFFLPLSSRYSNRVRSAGSQDLRQRVFRISQVILMRVRINEINIAGIFLFQIIMHLNGMPFTVWTHPISLHLSPYHPPICNTYASTSLFDTFFMVVPKALTTLYPTGIPNL